jgi:hypothetical protein
VIYKVAGSFKLNVTPSFLHKLAIIEAEVIRLLRQPAPADNQQCDVKQKAKCKFEHGEFFDWVCEQCEKNPSGRNNAK